MKFVFTNKGVKLADVDREMIKKKFERLEKFFRDDSDAHVVLRAQRGKIIVGVTIFYKGIIFRSEAAEDFAISATDECITALNKQIKKNKSRLSRHIRDISLDNNSAFEGTDSEDEDAFVIERAKKIVSKPMTVEEAVLQMNMLAHDFFMFTNADGFLPSLVYKRKGGGYGLIEMEE
jgi:putative sigma-54 modulation protein